MRHITATFVASVLTFFCMANNGFACSVPVFRYALENWEPDRLTVVILHVGVLSDRDQALVDQLQQAADDAEELVNLELHPIDVSADHRAGSADDIHSKQWRSEKLPHMLVYFSNDAPQPQQAWSAPFNQENVEQLLNSPARKEVVERLLDGQSAVWVLMKTGNKAADDRAEHELKTELAKKPDEIELPSLTDLESEEKFDEDLKVEMRVEFSVISIEPDDKQETFFREMLISTESDLKDFKGPIAIPIYGRGRTYFALVGAGITSDTIAENCNFICGACSCEVKRDNPGQDLLLAANWNRVEPGNWVNDTPLPELTGIGGFEAVVGDVTGDEPIGVNTESGTTPTQESAASTASSEEAAGSDSVTPHSDGDGVLVATASPELAPNAVSEDAQGSGAESSTDEGSNSSTSSVAPLILLWGAVLFGAGLVFTVWQRQRSQE